MDKIILKPEPMIYPLPAVMVSCGSSPSEYNIITISWTGTICSDPPMCYISVRPGRYSYDIIRRTGEYVINLTTSELAQQTDWCGIKSGRDHNKFKELGLTASAASMVSAPVINESPLNIECVVREIKELGVHHMFISEIVALNASKDCLDEKGVHVDLKKINLIAYSKGSYFEKGSFIGQYGYSAKQPE